MNVQTGYAEINGARMYYEIAGKQDAKTLVFLHAAVVDRRMWDAQFEAFAQDYRIIRYDLRGAGNTEASPMPFSHIDDLRGLLAHLSVERATLIGCSNGAQTALDFALTYQERVSGLVLASPALSGYEMQGEPPPLIIQIGQALQKGDLERAADLQTQQFYVGENRSPEQVDAAGFQLTREMTLQALKRMGTGLGDEKGAQPPAVGRLGEAHMPTLVIVGSEDNPAILAIGDTIASGIPGARRVVIPNAAHLPSLERPHEFNRILSDFLNTALRK